MPADTATQTITVDREAVLDLLVEVYALVDVHERLAGTSPTSVTDELGTKLEGIAAVVLGPLPEGDDEFGPRVALWDAGSRRADVLMGLEIDAPPVIQELAAALAKEGGDG